MGKFIKNLIVFSIVAIISYILLIGFAGKFFSKGVAKNLKYVRGGTGFLYNRLREADTVSGVDILVIGSSHAYRGFDPRIFEQHHLRLFNLGSSSQSFIQSNVLLDRYLDKMKPKRIIVDVYPGLLASDGIESSLDLISNESKESSFWKLLCIQKDINIINVGIFSYFEKLIHPDYTPKEIQGKDKYIKGGYVENNMSNVDTNIARSVITSKDIQINSFHLLLDKLRKRNIPFILVQTPITKAKLNSFENIRDFDEIFKKEGRYLNFNDVMNLDNTFFLDDHHLNQKGVNAYNLKLISELSKQHFFDSQNYIEND